MPGPRAPHSGQMKNMSDCDAEHSASRGGPTQWVSRGCVCAGPNTARCWLGMSNEWLNFIYFSCRRDDSQLGVVGKNYLHRGVGFGAYRWLGTPPPRRPLRALRQDSRDCSRRRPRHDRRPWRVHPQSARAAPEVHPLTSGEHAPRLRATELIAASVMAAAFRAESGCSRRLFDPWAA
jgi:hypothetical protein